jgi:hypothetical protein
MSMSEIWSLFKMSVSLQIALAAETHQADGLIFKLWFNINVEKSLIILAGILYWQNQIWKNSYFCFNCMIKEKGIKMPPCGIKCWNI